MKLNNNEMIKGSITYLKLLLSVFLSVVTCVSCNKESDSLPQVTFDSDYGLYVIDDGQEVSDIEDTNSAFNDKEKMIGRALNDYAVKMLIDYEEDKGNTLLSPISMSVLYSMLANFTGETSNNTFQEGLGIGNYSMSDINSYCRKLVRNGGTSDGGSLAIHNDVWINNKSSVYNSFLSMAKKYKVQVKGIEFGSTSGNAAMNNSIGDKVKDADISGKTSWEGVNMAVTSSMYIEKKWKDNFSLTRKEYDFANADGSKYTNQMLESTRYARYASFKYFDMLEIPYEGDDYCLYVVYPHDEDMLDESLMELGNIGFVKCVDSMKEEYVRIRIPRFSNESLVSLNPQAGMANNSASSMFQTKLPKVSPANFSLNDVYQACKMEINQEGMSVKVEASGLVTVTAQGATSGGTSGPRVSHYFEIEHPFAIFIRSNRLGVIPYASCIKSLKD